MQRASGRGKNLPYGVLQLYRSNARSAIVFRFLLSQKEPGAVGCLPRWGRWREAPEGLTDRTAPPHSARSEATPCGARQKSKSAKGGFRRLRTATRAPPLTCKGTRPLDPNRGLHRIQVNTYKHNFISAFSVFFRPVLYKQRKMCYNKPYCLSNGKNCRISLRKERMI